ncbi:MAG: CinA family protein [Actinomycetota bacterium]
MVEQADSTGEGGGGETLEAEVSRRLREAGLSLALAESVTGGLIASRLVGVPGASNFLRAGYVAYSHESKRRDLGVSAEILESHGAVSGPVATAMAEGARRRAGADLGLATTGEAGPEPFEALAGTVFVALSWKGDIRTEALVARGDREAIRSQASEAALDLLRRRLIGEIRSREASDRPPLP